VYCLQNGYGVIDKINTDNGIYQIVATFPCLIIGHYCKDGRLATDHKNPMLYPAKPEIIVPKWQPKPGEWCWFWDENDVGVFIIQQFSRIVGEGYCGTTGTRWDNCAPFIGELPEHLKEVEK
jgi:hypothetical protein